MGRFLSRDTWAVDTWNPVEVNRYVYAAANPVMFADPTGNTASGEYGKITGIQGGSAASGGTVTGVNLAYVYNKTMLLMYRAAPFFQTAICLAAELGTDAEFGPTCDVLPDLPAIKFKSLRRLFKVSDSDYSANTVRILRQGIHGLWRNRIIREAIPSQLNKKNFGTLRILVNGRELSEFWAVSGIDGKVTREINEAMTRYGLNVVENVGKYGGYNKSHAEPKLLMEKPNRIRMIELVVALLAAPWVEQAPPLRLCDFEMISP